MKDYRSVVFLFGPGAVEYGMETLRGKSWNPQNPFRIEPDSGWEKHFSDVEPLMPYDMVSACPTGSRKNSMSYIAPLIVGKERGGGKVLFCPTEPKLVDTMGELGEALGWFLREGGGSVYRRTRDYLPKAESSVGIGTCASNTPFLPYGCVLLPGEAVNSEGVRHAFNHIRDIKGGTADGELQFGKSGLANTIKRPMVWEANRALTVGSFDDRNGFGGEDFRGHCYSQGYACNDMESGFFLYACNFIKTPAGLALVVAEAPGEEPREFGPYKEDPLPQEVRDSLKACLFGAARTALA